MTLRHPTMQELLAHAPQRWAPRESDALRGPVIAISRLPGAGGRALAFELARRLDLDVQDRDLLHQIAERSGVRDRNVSDLEAEDRALLTQWLTPFASDVHLEPRGYLEHLTKIVQAIARAGGAVIVGRGAHLILSHGEALRVLVVAPLEARVAAVAAKHCSSLHDAEQRIHAMERERHAFLRRYFRGDLGDPASFDLVVNTAVLGVPGAADAVEACLRQTRPAVRACTSGRQQEAIR